MADVPGSSSHIKYSKLGQLIKHSRLQFEVQMLKLERHLLDELHVTLTEFLNSSQQICR